MKKLLALCLLITFIVTAPASAHVVVESESGSSRAVLHVTPDDDPIAGSKTELYFDIRSDRINPDDYLYTLNIINSAGVKEGASVVPVGQSGILAEYVFVSQGMYELELIASPIWASTSDKSVEKFKYTQRVSRGINGEVEPAEVYAWAEAGLIGSFCALLAILILVINRRREIAAFSRDEVKRRP